MALSFIFPHFLSLVYHLSPFLYTPCSSPLSFYVRFSLIFTHVPHPPTLSFLSFLFFLFFLSCSLYASLSLSKFALIDTNVFHQTSVVVTNYIQGHTVTTPPPIPLPPKTPSSIPTTLPDYPVVPESRCGL